MATRKMEASANQKRPPQGIGKGKKGRPRRRPPNEQEIVRGESQGLEALLRARGCLSVDRLEDEQRRQSALKILEKILCEWASAVQAKSSDSKWRQARVSLVTFGSYRLGVHRAESDLDVLAMSPPACSRGDFFTSLPDLLQKDSRIEDVHAIPSAYTVRSQSLISACDEFSFAHIHSPPPPPPCACLTACCQVSSQWDPNRFALWTRRNSVETA